MLEEVRFRLRGLTWLVATLFRAGTRTLFNAF
jgi:hypothetical protein